MIFYSLRRFGHIVEMLPRYMNSKGGSRGLYILMRTVQVALADDIVTDDESAMLKVIESVMGLDSGSVQDCFAIARGDMMSPFTDTDVEGHTNRKLGDLAMYQNVLITALDDEVITDDEMAMLDVLRRVLRLQSDEHALMVEQIRLLASRSDASERLTERMERYLVRHPFS
jgi:tellurite resistance protein